MDSFDIGFNNWMSAAIEYEMLKRQGKEIPPDVQKKLDSARDWISNLSDENYSRLIH